jgi:hypothetical protein
LSVKEKGKKKKKKGPRCHDLVIGRQRASEDGGKGRGNSNMSRHGV